MRILSVTLILMYLTLILTGCIQRTISPSSDIDVKIQRLMEGYHVPGVSITVINNYEIDWAKGYGICEDGDSEPITTNTLFQAASIGKSLTAVASLHLVEQGLLDLDENVNDGLVSWNIPENEFTKQEKVTLRRLLSHSAGVTTSGFQGYSQDDELPTLQQILNGDPPANTPPILVDLIPGTQRRYSGGGYMIVQQLLEDVVDKPFPEIMKENIFKPIGMTSSLYAAPLPVALRNKVATAHSAEGQPAPGKWYELPEFGAGGGLWTTSSDLARFTIEMMLSSNGVSNKILSQKSVSEMLTPQDVDRLQGLGFNVLWDRAITHTGHNPPGFAGILVALPEEGWGAIVLTNGDNGRWLRHEIVLPLTQEYGLFPQVGLLVTGGISLIFLLVTLFLWPVHYLLQHWRNRKSKSDESPSKKLRAAKAARSIAILETVLIFLVIGLYIVYFSALQGPMTWSEGTLLVKILYALAFISTLLAVVLVVFTVLMWKNRFWSIAWHMHYTLFTIAVLIGIYIVFEFGHTAVVLWVISLGVG
ncbi:serine hydrolase domain-containing protein [Chloroflexota bacterium]